MCIYKKEFVPIYFQHTVIINSSVWQVEALPMLAGKVVGVELIPTTWPSLLFPVSSPLTIIHFLLMILALYKEAKGRFCPCFSGTLLRTLKALIKT